MLSSIILCGAMCVPPPSNVDLPRILNCIQKVETGGCKNPSAAIGDNGKAIGPFQIHKVYWQDAIEYDPSIGGRYSDCTDVVYARKIVVAYLSRYATNWNIDTVAGVHNGGPKGNVRSSTEGYRNKVRKAYNGK